MQTLLYPRSQDEKIIFKSKQVKQGSQRWKSHEESQSQSINCIKSNLGLVSCMDLSRV